MAAIALQRELDAYSDAINTYNRQARSYKSAATQHNASIDEYKASFVPNSKSEIGVFARNRSGGYESRGNVAPQRISADQAKNYKRIDLGNNLFSLQYIDQPVARPGEFTMAEPTRPGSAPTATTAQIKKLDQPSLTDVERVSDSGLINNAFKY
jgi:hypothetical protein